MSVSIKHLRSAQSSRLHKLGASGSLKLARKGEHAPRKYASGGGVDASPIDGAPARPRLDKPGRKMAGKGKDKGKGTNVNVIVMPRGGDGPGAPPPMPMPPPGAGPGPGGPPPGPPGPPMPPMRKHGGAVGKYATGGRIANLGKYAHGGKVQKKADGGWTGEGDSGKALREKAKEVRDEPNVGKALAGNAGQVISNAIASRRPGAGIAGILGTTGYAAKKWYDSITQGDRAKELESKADKAEGHKRGGSVKKSKC